jgi:hypothetical protein
MSAPLTRCVMCMRTRTKVLAVFGATIAAIGGYAFTYTGRYGEICERLGGKWASLDFHGSRFP